MAGSALLRKSCGRSADKRPFDWGRKVASSCRNKFARDTSVVISKFARFRYHSASELRNQNDTRINRLLVSLDSEIRFALDIKLVRISESSDTRHTLHHKTRTRAP